MVDEEQIYGYHYADPRIEVLVKYLQSFFQKRIVQGMQRCLVCIAV